MLHLQVNSSYDGQIHNSSTGHTYDEGSSGCKISGIDLGGSKDIWARVMSWRRKRDGLTGWQSSWQTGVKARSARYQKVEKQYMDSVDASCIVSTASFHLYLHLTTFSENNTRLSPHVSIYQRSVSHTWLAYSSRLLGAGRNWRMRQRAPSNEAEEEV